MTYRATFRSRPYARRGRQLRTRTVPGRHHEALLAAGGARLVCGVDEVGVGAWAGPVAVGCVILDPQRRIYKVRDSKLLDPPRREWLAGRVKERALAWSVGLAWPAEIDAGGLSAGIRLAAERALQSLPVPPDALLGDGKWNYLGDNATMVVRGDCESVSIASASIVAKCYRDSLMKDLAMLYPEYLFDSNKGYPSPRHKWALAAFGPSPVHRRLFAPVAKLFDEGVPGRLLTAGTGAA